MVRFSVMYPSNTGKFDFDSYTQNHMALVHRLLEPYGLVRTEIDRGLGADRLGIAAPYLAICHFEFNSLEEMLKGIVPHFQDIEADANKFTDIKPKYQISEILR